MGKFLSFSGFSTTKKKPNTESIQKPTLGGEAKTFYTLAKNYADEQCGTSDAVGVAQERAELQAKQIKSDVGFAKRFAARKIRVEELNRRFPAIQQEQMLMPRQIVIFSAALVLMMMFTVFLELAGRKNVENTVPRNKLQP